MDGYDVSGYSRTFGPLMWTFDETELTTLTDGVKGYLPAHPTLGIGTLNGVFDNTATSGLHVLANAAGVKRTLMIPIGIRAAPAQGDPVYMGEFEQSGYYQEGPYVNVPFGMSSAASTSLLYSKPWGWLLHAKSNVDTENDQTGIDDNGASSSFGGFMMYQVFSGDGGATISVEDAATNSDGDFAALSGATTGVIDCTSPTAGIVAIGRTATVQRYLRWQIEFDDATEVEFALSFVRATY